MPVRYGRWRQGNERQEVGQVSAAGKHEEGGVSEAGLREGDAVLERVLGSGRDVEEEGRDLGLRWGVGSDPVDEGDEPGAGEV